MEQTRLTTEREDGYVIRQAAAADEASIRALFEEMLRTINHTDAAQGYEPGYLDRYWTGGADRIFVADSGGVVGFLSVEVHREREDYAYLDDFSVTEAYRGRGIGTALIRAAEEYARELALGAVLLHAEKTNEAARRFYAREGFTVFRDDGTRLLLCKELQRPPALCKIVK